MDEEVSFPSVSLRLSSKGKFEDNADGCGGGGCGVDGDERTERVEVLTEAEAACIDKRRTTKLPKANLQ